MSVWMMNNRGTNYFRSRSTNAGTGRIRRSAFSKWWPAVMSHTMIRDVAYFRITVHSNDKYRGCSSINLSLLARQQGRKSLLVSEIRTAWHVRSKHSSQRRTNLDRILTIILQSPTSPWERDISNRLDNEIFSYTILVIFLGEHSARGVHRSCTLEDQAIFYSILIATIILRHIKEHSEMFRRSATSVFFDLKLVFDSVDHETFWTTFHRRIARETQLSPSLRAFELWGPSSCLGWLFIIVYQENWRPERLFSTAFSLPLRNLDDPGDGLIHK